MMCLHNYMMLVLIARVLMLITVTCFTCEDFFNRKLACIAKFAMTCHLCDAIGLNHTHGSIIIL